MNNEIKKNPTKEICQIIDQEKIKEKLSFNEKSKSEELLEKEALKIRAKRYIFEW